MQSAGSMARRGAHRGYLIPLSPWIMPLKNSLPKPGRDNPSSMPVSPCGITATLQTLASAAGSVILKKAATRSKPVIDWRPSIYSSHEATRLTLPAVTQEQWAAVNAVEHDDKYE
jgi:hypothetical protein